MSSYVRPINGWVHDDYELLDLSYMVDKKGNKMKYTDPTPDQLKLMQDYSDICSKGIELIMNCEQNIMLQHASARMQESMNWFHTYVINGGKIAKDNGTVN